MTAKRKEYGFVVLSVANNQLMVPDNKVSQFLNSGEVRSVLSVTSSYNPQFGADREVTVLYEKEPPKTEGKDDAESREQGYALPFKKRRKPDPLR